MLRAYLWGIETEPLGLPKPQEHLVASLPMRNWNQPRLNPQEPPGTRCEPTYEELKHIMLRGLGDCLFVLRAYLWGIETLVPTSLATIPPPGCEPTYEELKHKYAKPYVFLQLMLRAYLWGIETACLTARVLAPSRCEPTYEELKLLKPPLCF